MNKKNRGRINRLEDVFGKKTALGPPRILFTIWVAPYEYGEDGFTQVGPDRNEAMMEDETLSASIDDIRGERVQRLDGETIDHFKARLIRLPHGPAEFFRTIHLFSDRQRDEVASAPAGPQAHDIGRDDRESYPV
jgi:hypothetical protein